jgi:hypothetical protein
LAADVVLADGSFVHANHEHHPDLFWALRGGGGNFGVVTSFLFKLHPISTVMAGPMFWKPDRAVEVMRWYRDFIRDAPDEVNGFFTINKVPPVPPFPESLHEELVCGVVWCFTGTVTQVDKILEPIRKLAGGPVIDLVGPTPYPALQSMFDPLVPSGLQWYWRADFFNELSDETIEQHLVHGSRIPTLLSQMHLYPINGAAGRVGRNETAFSYRDATWAQVIVGIDPEPGAGSARRSSLPFGLSGSAVRHTSAVGSMYSGSRRRRN